MGGWAVVAVTTLLCTPFLLLFPVLRIASQVEDAQLSQRREREERRGEERRGEELSFVLLLAWVKALALHPPHPP